MIYAYSGGLTGFYTAVFEIYRRRDGDALPQNRDEGVCGLCEIAEIYPEREKALRVERGLANLSLQFAHTVRLAWLSREPEADAALLALIRKAFAERADPMDQKYDPTVKQVFTMARHVSCEVERMLQFVRFSIHSGGLAVADIEPAYDVLPIIANHFCSRFPNQPFAIRDLRHRKTLLWDTKQRRISQDEALLLPKLPEDEEFSRLWQRYFRVLAIPERRNARLQMQNVPKKYRAHLTEMLEMEEKT